jgi:hypothetical protein
MKSNVSPTFTRTQHKGSWSYLEEGRRTIDATLSIKNEGGGVISTRTILALGGLDKCLRSSFGSLVVILTWLWLCVSPGTTLGVQVWT